MEKANIPTWNGSSCSRLPKLMEKNMAAGAAMNPIGIDKAPIALILIRRANQFKRH
jgi:hypothetical protein